MNARAVGRFVFAGVFLACLFGWGTVSSSVGAEALFSGPSSMAGGASEEIPVIIFLKDVEDLSSLPSLSHYDAISLLMENAERSRRSFIERFVSRVGRAPRVERTLWLVNAVCLRLSREQAAAVSSFDGVESVVPDRRIRLPRRELEVEGREPLTRGEWTYGLKILGVDRLRSEFGLTGAGVVVGHIDTGCDASHPDLAGKIAAFKDFVKGKEQPYDDQGHGTHTAGTIAGGNASGRYIGVAPDVKLVVAKVFDGAGSSQTSWLLDAMQWIVDPDGDPQTNDAPRVVNNSWGGAGSDTSFKKAVKRWIELGIFPCFAAGNSGPSARTIGSPASYVESFAVGATTSNDKIAYFSSRGPVEWDGKLYVKPDVSAPGYGVYSALPGGGYGNKSGTSMACPHACGVIALLYQARPDLTIDGVWDLMKRHVKDLGDSGKDNTFGWGRIEARDMVAEIFRSGVVKGFVSAADGGALPARIVFERKKDGNKLETIADESGKFEVRLAEGKYAVHASCFGYEMSKPLEVEVREDSVSSVAIEMRRLPGGIVSLSIVDAADGAPVERGTVVVRGAAQEGGTVEFSGGSCSFFLPRGRHVMDVHGFGYKAGVVEVEMGDSDLSAECRLDHLPPFLLVDQDARHVAAPYFEKAMEDAGYAYDLVEHAPGSGPLPADLLLQYQWVVWFSGGSYSGVMDETDMKRLEEYLSSGGRLLVSGQDIAYSHSKDSRFESLFGVEYVKDRASSRKVEGASLSFSIAGGDGADNQKYPDVISPAAGSEKFLRYVSEAMPGGEETAGVWRTTSSGGAVVFLGFGIEGVSSASARRELLKFCVQLGGGLSLRDLAARHAWMPPRVADEWLRVVERELQRADLETLEKLGSGGAGMPPLDSSVMRLLKGLLLERREDGELH